jgi:hypothetical protein
MLNRENAPTRAHVGTSCLLERSGEGSVYDVLPASCCQNHSDEVCLVDNTFGTWSSPNRRTDSPLETDF